MGPNFKLEDASTKNLNLAIQKFVLAFTVTDYANPNVDGADQEKSCSTK